MRLFRRSLLCLIVGVMAFGVAGWVFRPRASWSVELGAFKTAPEIVPLAHGSGFNDTVWLSGVDHGANDRLVVWCLDLAQKSVRRRLELPSHDVNAAKVLPDGSLLVVQKVFHDYSVQSTRFTLVPIQPSADLQSRMLEGNWEVTGSGSRIFSFRLAKSELEFAYSSVGEPWTTAQFNLGECRRVPTTEDHAAAVSNDGRLLALSDSVRAGRMPPYGIEVWQVDEGRLVHALKPPKMPNLGPFEPALLGFSEDNRTALFGNLNFPRDWIWEFKSDSVLEKPLTKEPMVPLPLAGEDRHRREKSDEDEDLELWVASTDQSAHFMLRRRESQILPWRSYPFEIASPNEPNVNVRTPTFQLVPSSNEIVARCEDTPLWSTLPRSIRVLLPADWTASESTVCFRWHDWRKDEWRDIGCPSSVRQWTSRPGTFLAVSASNDICSFTSWPLPPRDPKWPALGVAALATAGTWWLCAWRYRRRTRLANAGAA